MVVDNLAKKLGEPGRFQVILYVMLCCNFIFVSWNHLGMAFIGAKTEHHCQLENKTVNDDLVPTVKKGGKIERDKCHLFNGYNSSVKVSCVNGWTYYLEDRETTIISQVSSNH